MKRAWSANTYESHDVSLSLFEAWLRGRSRRKHIGLGSLSREVLGGFWDHCHHERGCAVNTANLRIRSVEQWWRWAFEHDDFGIDTPRPRTTKLPAREQHATYAPTWAQMDASIEAHTTVHYRRLCMLLRCTGLRKTQALAVRWEDVDLDAVTLYVRPELGKTKAERRGRLIPIAPVLVEELAGWGRREGLLLPWPSDRRVAHNIVLEGAWVRAGVGEHVWRKRTAHAYRKGFVTGLRAVA